MIPYSLKDGNKEVLKFSIPQSWEECTLAQMIQVQKFGIETEFPFTKQLEIMTGIPETDWLNCSVVSLDTMLLPHLAWMKEPLDEAHLSALPVPDSVTIGEKTYQVPKNIDLKTFGQKITFQTEMAKYAVKDGEGNVTGFELNFFPVAIAIYLYPEKVFEDAAAFKFAAECEKIPLREAYPLACFFFREIFRLITRDKEFLHYEPDEQKLRAGIDRFDKFGFKNTLYALTGGDLTKEEFYLQMPYGEIFVKLMFDVESSRFQERYREIVKADSK